MRDWAKLVAELHGREYRRGIVTPDTVPFRIVFDPGLDDAEVARIERRHGITLPSELRAFLQTAVPRGVGFPDWRADRWQRPCEWMEGVLEDVLFDIDHGVWMPAWGERPANDEAARALVTARFAAAPPLVPVFAHRMVPCSPIGAVMPVLSVHQTDVIYYGCDLDDYLRQEFGLGNRRPWPAELPHIPFWSDLL